MNKLAFNAAQQMSKTIKTKLKLHMKLYSLIGCRNIKQQNTDRSNNELALGAIKQQQK
jgi:hypothetical protein